MTPDEVRQERWDGASETDLAGAVVVEAGCKDIRIGKANINGRIFGDIRIDRYEEDALILCFSSVLDGSIMRRLQKMCCLEIVDLDRLISAVADKFGRVLFGYMKYTRTDERSHFIRSADDEWMQEYRIVIPGHDQEALLRIPPGIARKADVSLAV